MFDKLLHLFRNPVAEVPEDIAVCEFDCEETECRLGDWDRCERRLKAQAIQHRASEHQQP
jgi:hypothetical protein